MKPRQRRSARGIAAEPSTSVIAYNPEALSSAAVRALHGDVPDAFKHNARRNETNPAMGVNVFLGPDFAVLVETSDRDEAWAAQRQHGLYYLYAIARRPRIRVATGTASVNWREVRLEVATANGWKNLALPAPLPRLGDLVAGLDDGARFRLTRMNAEGWRGPAWMLADAIWDESVEKPQDLDLELLYIGQSIGGAKNPSSALQRLDRHETYQRILEDHRQPELQHNALFVYLGAGTAINVAIVGEDDDSRTFHELADETQRIRRGFSRGDRVSVIEATLINYFKPPYNIRLRFQSCGADGRTANG